MKILPDGRVEITNKSTGEVKQINPTELGSYNPFLVSRYDDEMKRRKEAATNAAPNVSSYLPIGTQNIGGVLNTTKVDEDTKVKPEIAGASGFFEFNPATLPGTNNLSNPNLFSNIPSGMSTPIPNIPTNPKVNLPFVVKNPYGEIPINNWNLLNSDDPNKLKMGGY